MFYHLKREEVPQTLKYKKCHGKPREASSSWSNKSVRLISADLFCILSFCFRCQMVGAVTERFLGVEACLRVFSYVCVYIVRSLLWHDLTMQHILQTHLIYRNIYLSPLLHQVGLNHELLNPKVTGDEGHSRQTHMHVHTGISRVIPWPLLNQKSYKGVLYYAPGCVWEQDLTTLFQTSHLCSVFHQTKEHLEVSLETICGTWGRSKF